MGGSEPAELAREEAGADEAIDVHVVDGPMSQRRVVVANFPTKQHWRDPSRIEWIDAGLAALPRIIAEQNAGSIAVPPLCCDLGGLDWALVRGLVVDAMTSVVEAAVDVLVFPPGRH